MGYAGHDLRIVYKSLEARGKREKGEFETTDAFNARMEQEDKLPLFGSVNKTDNLALLISDPETGYNADNQSFKILLPTEWSSQDKYMLGIKGQEISRETKTYTGGNTYGARVNVKSYSSSTSVLAITNHMDFAPEGSTPIDRYVRIVVENVPVDIAKKLKGNLSAVCVFKLELPFIATDGFLSKPAISDPTEVFKYNELIFGRISSVIIFNKKSGKVLYKETLEQSKQ